MQHVIVESTTLASAGHEGRAAILELLFRNGAVYQYFHVPAEVHRGLLGAPSKGRYFNQHIRGRYPYKLVQNATCPARCC